MAYSTARCYGNHQTIHTELATLLNSLSIATLHSINVVKIGSDYFFAIVTYTAS